MVKGLKKRILDFIEQRRVLVVAVLGGTALAILVQNFEMNLFEAYLYDLRVRTSRQINKDETHTVIVNIDDQSIEQMNEYAPLSIKTHIELLKKLGSSKPKAIAYLLDFNDSIASQNTNTLEPVSSSKFKSKTIQKSDADLFVDEAESLTTNGVPVWLGTDVDVTGEVLPPYPLSKLPHRAALIHKDGTNFSEDKVTRRAVFSIYDEPVLHVQLASALTGKIDHQDYRGVYLLPDVEARYFLINYSGNTKDSLHPFSEISAIDILNGKIPEQYFKNKIVLIGTKTRDNSSDYSYTPFSRNIFTNSKLVIHANIIETLIRNNAIISFPKWIDFILTLALTCLVIVLVFRTTPEKGVLTTIIGSLIILSGGLFSYRFLGWWFNLSHPLVGVWSAYYIFVPYRLIMEYKKRWDIEQKHEVLVQIEELKSNFMSLITHDLKTPVARIQGMAEILTRSGAEPKVVNEIMLSTDELNRFITSILELAKIESNRMQINRQNKDINKLIESCIQKFEFSARAKNIDLKTNLEPLFPIMMDTPLIDKVVSNLIDNAIKYSPVGSHVEITSKESDFKEGFIEIIIKDNGSGISLKDQDNIFQKFYRAKNDITMMTKGTGLGLYLSRYFVELHNGTISLNSQEGKGSTFTILLPIDDRVPIKKDNKLSRFNFFHSIKSNKNKQVNNNHSGGIKYV